MLCVISVFLTDGGLTQGSPPAMSVLLTIVFLNFLLFIFDAMRGVFRTEPKFIPPNRNTFKHQPLRHDWNSSNCSTSKRGSIPLSGPRIANDNSDNIRSEPTAIRLGPVRVSEDLPRVL